MSKKSRHEPHEEHADETWLIPYADLLTLLLALFIVLFASSSVDSKKFQDMSRAFSLALNSGTGILENTSIISNSNEMERKRKDNDDGNTKRNKANEALAEKIRKEQEDFEKLKKKLDQYIKDNGLTTQLETKLNQSELKITISDKALFASGSANVKTDSRTLAVTISNMLQPFPDYEVVVAGHTDNQPIRTKEFESNWDLSSKRALNFMKILLNNASLNPKMFSNIGYGEYHPVDSNETDLGRAKNRRVEVSIIRKFKDPSAESTMSASGQ